MKNNRLTKLSLIISILGTFLLLVLSEVISPPLVKINEINEDYLESKIRIQGILISIKETPGLYLLNIKESNGIINAVVFKNSELELKKGDLIEIEGAIELYENTLEIIADKITLLE